jgi:hypothetical protein
MNVILFMSKALYQTGMAAPQAERENKGPPLSDIDEVVIFDSLRRNPYCSTYSFVECIQKMPSTFWSRDGFKEAKPPPGALPSGLKPHRNGHIQVHETRSASNQANGSCNAHHVLTLTVSTPLREQDHHDGDPPPQR